VKESSPQILSACAIFKNLPQESNHPIGEKSPNLVTLAARKGQMNLSFPVFFNILMFDMVLRNDSPIL
jgi:hypothetical protein